MLAFALLGTLLALATAQSSTPPCLDACLPPTERSQIICSLDDLPSVLACVNSTCTHANLASHMTLAYTPKILYSCEQSMVPGSNIPSDTLTLHGDGSCETSPYGFRSFVAGTGSETMDEVCEVEVYDQEACSGHLTRLPLYSMAAGECQFQGGRSARMICQVRSQSQVAMTHLRAMCPSLAAENQSSTTSTTLNAYATPSSGNATAVPTTGFNAPANATGGEASVTAQPFMGSAAQTARASVAALMCLTAVFAML